MPADTQTMLALGGQQFPRAKNIVNLVHGTPYVVPEGKTLIITDWSVRSTTNAFYSIKVNSERRWEADTYQTTSAAPFGVRAQSLRSGVRANAGETVELTTNSTIPTFRMDASGYLESAN